MQNSASEPIPVPLWRWMLLAWLILWGLSFLSLLSFLCIVLAVLLARLAWLSRSWRPVCVLLASPFAFYFAAGTARWFDEQPSFLGCGLPKLSSFNLKADTRCYWRSSGCIVDGSEWVWQMPSNLGLLLMCKVFGWPPHSYHGTYPDAEEAARLTSSAETVPWEIFKIGTIKTSAIELKIGEYQAVRIAREAKAFAWDEPEKNLPQIQASPTGNDCVLLRIINTNADEPADIIYLLDRKDAWPFARYVIRGHADMPYFGSRRAL